MRQLAIEAQYDRDFTMSGHAVCKQSCVMRQNQSFSVKSVLAQPGLTQRDASRAISAGGITGEQNSRNEMFYCPSIDRAQQLVIKYCASKSPPS
jgi:hypothetical protein